VSIMLGACLTAVAMVPARTMTARTRVIAQARPTQRSSAWREKRAKDKAICQLKQAGARYLRMEVQILEPIGGTKG